MDEQVRGVLLDRDVTDLSEQRLAALPQMCDDLASCSLAALPSDIALTLLTRSLSMQPHAGGPTQKARVPMATAENYRPNTEHTHLGIGLIGCGSIAQGAHLPAYRKHGFDVVAAFDISPASSAQVTQDFGIPATGTIEELLANPQ